LSATLIVCHRDGLVADAIRAALEDEGFDVAIASRLDDALELAGSTKTYLIDVRMTGAFDIVRRLTSLPGSPRVYALVDDETRQIAAAARSGASGWVTTADGIGHLIHVLRSEGQAAQAVPADERRRVSGRGRQNRHLLTARETEVLAGLIQGESTKALAARLHVSQATARTHVQNVLTKLGVHSRLQAVAVVIEHSLLSLFDLDDDDDGAAALSRETTNATS
jgi:two-component system, NarL family, nitrate/nitrite response regulator NarL